MSLLQFIAIQGLMFFLFIFSAALTGGGQGVAANFMMNLLTFLTASWILARSWIRTLSKEMVWFLVLATTLSFNLVTYLLNYAAYVPMPNLSAILQDFGLVTGLSVLGIFLGLKSSRPQQG